jgi:hypothetical protein
MQIPDFDEKRIVDGRRDSQIGYLQKLSAEATAKEDPGKP